MSYEFCQMLTFYHLLLSKLKKFAKRGQKWCLLNQSGVSPPFVCIQTWPSRGIYGCCPTKILILDWDHFWCIFRQIFYHKIRFDMESEIPKNTCFTLKKTNSISYTFNLYIESCKIIIYVEKLQGGKCSSPVDGATVLLPLDNRFSELPKQIIE